MKKVTEDFILKKAGTSFGFTMHKYKWSHDYVRKMCKGLVKKNMIYQFYEDREEVIFKVVK